MLNNNSNSKNKKYLLDYEKLQTGDIILENGDTPIISYGIKKATSSDFSHSMIVIRNNVLFHATGRGVYTYSPKMLRVKNKTDFRVLRLKNKLSSEKLKDLEIFLQKQVGNLYSTIEALRTLPKLSQFRTKSNLQFCSKLIAQAYNHIGIKIVDNIDYCSPEDINKDIYSIFEVIPDMVKEINKAELREVNLIDKKDNLFLKNQSSIHKLVIQVRKLAKKERCKTLINGVFSEEKECEVLNLNDIDSFLTAYPKYDTEISKYLQKSGLLENYKIITKYTYLDKKSFLQYCDNNIECIFKEMLLHIVNSDMNNYIRTYKIYREHFQTHKLEYFENTRKLYYKLLSIEVLILSIFMEISKDLFNEVKSPTSLKIRKQLTELQNLNIKPYDPSQN